VYQVGDQPRLYYDARSINHQDYRRCKLPTCFGHLLRTSSWSCF